MPAVQLLCGDSRELLQDLPECSVSAVLTDPPYGLTSIVKRFGRNGAAPAKEGTDGRFARASRGFMGQVWDGTNVQNDPEFWRLVWRVMKPGAHLMAFGGTRTYHRMACAIEDAGFECRDMLAWLYGSGFPKNHDASKAIDKKKGAQREKVGANPNVRPKHRGLKKHVPNLHCHGIETDLTAPATSEAAQWDGWGTALKPALEPILLARKPLEGTVAANVLKWGTGVLNVDACRLPASAGDYDHPGNLTKRPMAQNAYQAALNGSLKVTQAPPNPEGRWPSNVLLDEEAAWLLDGQSGESKSNGGNRALVGWHSSRGEAKPNWKEEVGYGDVGGASRFFYVAKPDKSERACGLNNQEIITIELYREEDAILWENAVQKVTLRVDTGRSVPKVIAASDAPNKSASEWSTLLFGNYTSAPFLKESRSITVTRTSSTTASRTLSWLIHLLTNDGTQVVNSAKASGGSHAASAEPSIPCLIITFGQPASLPGVGSVACGMRLRISASGKSPASHPTVKPVTLLRHLAKLICPPGAVLLDPFMGSGSTGIAAVVEQMEFIGFELGPEYFEIAQARIAWAQGNAGLFEEDAPARPFVGQLALGVGEGEGET